MATPATGAMFTESNNLTIGVHRRGCIPFLIPVNMYRSVSTAIWTDDAILSMSPEQKLLFLYLHTNPYTSACGIYKMQIRTMAFQVGLVGHPFESAIKGLCAAFPDFVAVDFQTGEIGLLQYPRQVLIAASKRVMGHVEKEIEKVESQYLLRELMQRNSASINRPYLAQLRRLQAQKLNEVDFYGDLPQLPEPQQDNRKREKEIEKENKERPRDKRASLAILDDPDFKAELKEKFPTLNGSLEIELDKCRDYLAARGKRQKDYAAYARNWMRNAIKFNTAHNYQPHAENIGAAPQIKSSIRLKP